MIRKQGVNPHELSIPTLQSSSKMARGSRPFKSSEVQQETGPWLGTGEREGLIKARRT